MTGPRRRRADRWRPVVALALILASASILLSAWLFTRIQGERARNVRASCEQTNARNQNTIAELDRLLAKRLGSASPAQRQQIVQSRTNTVLLIQALVPRRDCDAYVRQQVNQ